MRKHYDNYEWWSTGKVRGSRADIVLPYITAAIFLGCVVYVVLKWLKIL